MSWQHSSNVSLWEHKEAVALILKVLGVMSKRLDAIYENGVFYPLEPPEHDQNEEATTNHGCDRDFTSALL